MHATRDCSARPGTAVTTPTFRWEGLLVALCCLAVVAVYHRQAIATGLDAIPADGLDSSFVLFVLDHWHRVFATGVPWREMPMFYPATETIGLSDLLVGLGLPYALLREAGLDSYAALNLIQMATTALGFLACHALLRGVLGLRLTAALAGAAFFALNYPRFAQTAHIQLQFNFLQPVLMAFALILFLQGRRLSRPAALVLLLGLGLGLVLQMATSVYPGWFMVFFFVVATVVAVPPAAVRRQALAVAHRLWPIALAAVAVTAVAAILLLAPLTVHESHWSYRFEIANFIPYPRDLLWIGDRSWLWGWVAPHFPEVNAANWTEKRLGYGIVVTLVILGTIIWGVWHYLRLPWRHSAPLDALGQRRAQDAVIAVLAVASLGIILVSLRYYWLYSPWYVIYKLFPGADGYRAVARNFLLLSLPYAMFIGHVMDRGLARLDGVAGMRRRAFAAAVAGLVAVGLAEQLASPLRHDHADYREPIDRLAERLPPDCRLFLLSGAAGRPPLTPETFDANAYLQVNADIRAAGADPWDHYVEHGRTEGRYLSPEDRDNSIRASIHAIMLAGKTGIPTVNGYSGKHPEGWALLNLFDPDLDEHARAWLQRNGADIELCVVPWS